MVSRSGPVIISKRKCQILVQLRWNNSCLEVHDMPICYMKNGTATPKPWNLWFVMGTKRGPSPRNSRYSPPACHLIRPAIYWGLISWGVGNGRLPLDCHKVVLRNRVMVTSCLPMYCWHDDMAIFWLPSSDERHDLTLGKPLNKGDFPSTPMKQCHQNQCCESAFYCTIGFLIFDLQVKKEEQWAEDDQWRQERLNHRKQILEQESGGFWNVVYWAKVLENPCLLMHFAYLSKKTERIAFGSFISPSVLSKLEQGHG